MKYFIFSLLLWKILPAFSQNHKEESCEIFPVYREFAYLLMDNTYYCWGKPSAKYQEHRCHYEKCRQWYQSQAFCKDGEVTIVLYNNMNCEYSTTGNHDDMELTALEPCRCIGATKRKESTNK